MQKDFNQLIVSYNDKSEIDKFDKSVQAFLALQKQLLAIPGEFKLRKDRVEAEAYESSLAKFLQNYRIDQYKIAGFGDTRKSILHGHGIYTAFDVKKVHHQRIRGIGPTYVQNILSWQRSIVNQFTYQPDQVLINRQVQPLAIKYNSDIAQLKNNIKAQYDSLSFIRTKLIWEKEHLKKRVLQLSELLVQAEYDYDMFTRSIKTIV